MAEIRPYRSEDLPALYEICLETGLSGADARHLYADRRIIGHVYAGPYGVLEPESALVIADAHGVGGYIIGTADTYAFEKRMEVEWWPTLRTQYADPPAPHTAWSADQRMAYAIHHSSRTPRRIAEPYPAHLHIDILPRLQGQGVGRALIDAWRAMMAARGVARLHLGVGPANARAVRFYQAYGFHEIERLPEPWNTIFFGIAAG
ncbi:MAG TPA: GNAT family N-acetyltransferase [Rhizomicrobium sp.]|jgi:ribosomal protein S18 acetylase RimI-like enzyme|nr:GNAT family N-acetyltransferase [Rhizomicrobium sp.]